jgi:CheY-like chemotaxis protein
MAEVAAGTVGRLNAEGDGVADVLIVGDEPAACEAMAGELRVCGATCQTADGGRGALMKLCEHTAGGRRFDAIILDSVIPDIDSWSVLRAIRGNPLWCDLRVIVLMGPTSGVADVVRAAEHDALSVQKGASSTSIIADLLSRFGGTDAPGLVLR